MADKAALRRVALAGPRAPDAAPRVQADPEQRLQGRGAYVCDAACASEAVRRRAFHRAFRRAVTVPDNLLESI